MITAILHTVQYSMIDTWLFTAVCLVLLAICAVLRIIITGPSTDDRFVAMNAAITIAAGSALGLGISWGDLFMLNMFVILIAFAYAIMFFMARSKDGEMA